MYFPEAPFSASARKIPADTQALPELRVENLCGTAWVSAGIFRAEAEKGASGKYVHAVWPAAAVIGAVHYGYAVIGIC